MSTTGTRSDTLVIGATGTTGSAVARALSARGVAYGGLTRRPDAILPVGGEPVVGDLADRDDVARALEGARAVYLVTPSTADAEDQQLAVVELANVAGVAHLVLLSQYAAAPDSPVRFLRYHAAVEEAVGETRMGATFLRPNLFMQGLLLFRDLIRTKGIIAAPIGTAKVSAIHVDDIGEVAAAALTGEPRGVLSLTGPEALTHDEMAASLASAAGRSIQFVDAAPDQFRESLAGHVPDWQVDGLVEDYAHYKAGEAEQVTGDVELVLGKPARSFATFAAEAAGLLQA
jgi:uncharacterized protein YbjT (DUF2867 family)